MGMFWVVLLVCTLKNTCGNVPKVRKNEFNENLALLSTMVEALKNGDFNNQLLFDLKLDNQHLSNRTISLLIKYAVKREVDKYRLKHPDSISRRLYSSFIMKLVDIAKDLPSNATPSSRVDTAHVYYNSIENQNPQFNTVADMQVFHLFVRLYDILFTAPKILKALGRFSELTPKSLYEKLMIIDVKPIHLGITLLVQYHLRRTVNFAIRSHSLRILTTTPQVAGADLVVTLKALASHLLPISELVDLHLTHPSAAFKDTSPSSWLGIVNSNNEE